MHGKVRANFLKWEITLNQLVFTCGWSQPCVVGVSVFMVQSKGSSERQSDTEQEELGSWHFHMDFFQAKWVKPSLRPRQPQVFPAVYSPLRFLSIFLPARWSTHPSPWSLASVLMCPLHCGLLGPTLSCLFLPFKTYLQHKTQNFLFIIIINM